MARKLVYEDFKENLPDQKTQDLHRAQMHARDMEEFNIKLQNFQRVQKEHAPFQNALLEHYKKEKIFDKIQLPERARKLSLGERKSLLKKLPVTGLKERIFQTGSLHVVDTSPFVGWVDHSERPTPANDAESYGDFSDGTYIYMDVSAGEDYVPGQLGNLPQRGGMTASFGYAGEYFRPAKFCVTTEAYLTVSASPYVTLYPNWAALPTIWGGAEVKLSVGVDLVANVYNDSELIEYYGTGNSFFTLDATSGMDNSYRPIARAVPITLSFPVNADFYYGVFVRFSMFCSVNEQKMIDGIPFNLSYVNGLLEAFVNELQFDAVFN
jgi:hypothetical protein